MLRTLRNRRQGQGQGQGHVAGANNVEGINNAGFMTRISLMRVNTLWWNYLKEGEHLGVELTLKRVNTLRWNLP